jgi:hypothetical protein
MHPLEDVVQVIFDGLLTDEQLLRDLAIRKSSRDPHGHFLLS